MLPTHKLVLETDDDLILKYKLSREEIERARSLNPPVGKPVDKLAARALSTGVPAFDRALGGGVFTKRLTEICGASATGKTTLCLSIALGAQHSTNKNICYIASESSIIFRKLRDLNSSVNASLDRVKTLPQAVTTGDAFISLVYSDELRDLFEQGLAVLIVDTLHKLDTNEIVSATKHLRDFAVKYDTAIVLTNGVVGTPAIDDTWVSPDSLSYSSEVSYVMGGSSSSDWSDHPKMGWGLARNVDTRILLTRVETAIGTQRTLKVLYSGDCAGSQHNFELVNEGIKYVPSKSPPADATPVSKHQMI